MNADLLTDTQNLISKISGQSIVRPTGGNPTTGINGFVFDILGEEEVRMESEITDHYTEDNSAAQDHIAKKPVIVTLKGYVGEVVEIIPNILLSLLAPIPALGLALPFVTQFSPQASQAYNAISNTANSFNNYIAQAQNVFSLISNALTGSTKQQNAYTTLKGFWDNRQPCSVETPYEVLKNMYIISIVPLQGEMTTLFSEFTVTFKQVRIVSTNTAIIPINNPAGSGTNMLPNPSGALQTTVLPLLSTAENNSINTVNNSLGRVSDSLSPVNNLGQTSGENSSFSILQGAFPIPLS